MTLFSRIAMPVAFALAFTLSSTMSSAVMISHNNSAIFADGFEDDLVGTQPAKWTVKDEDGAASGGVVEVLASGAAEGQNYLYLKDDGPDGEIWTDFTGVTTGVLHAEWMAYHMSADSGLQGQLQFNFESTGGGKHLRMMVRDESSTVWVKDATFGAVDTGLDVEFEQWQKWEVAYDLDAGTYEITLDGVSSGPLNGLLTELTDIGRVRFAHASSDSHYYLDAIPEPASMALMGCGGLLCLVRRRRRM